MDALGELAKEAGELSSHLASQYVFGSGAFGLTNYTVWMVICMVLVILVVVLASRRLTTVPKNKFVNLVEYGYQFIRNGVAEEVIGHGFKKHVPFLATLFFFIVISNFVGLVPGCKTPTGTISVTWVLSLVSFGYFVIQGIKTHGGWGYIKSLAPSGLPGFMVPIIWVLELVSTLVRALTLAVRLYGNMFAGHMVLGIFSIAASLFIGAAITNLSTDFIMALPGVLWLVLLMAMYLLEMLVAFLQAYIFTILSAVYISLATSDH